MIERFSIGVPAHVLATRYQVEEPIFQAKYNGAPTQLFPVLTSTAPNGFSFFYWGVAPQWSKNKSMAERLINVRAEQIAERPVLLKTLRKYRCIVPTDGFFVWRKVGKKTNIPWRLFPSTKTVESVACLWEEYDDEEGNSFHTFSMITKPSNGFSQPITDRVPFLLSREQEKTWLKNDTIEQALIELLQAPVTVEWDGFTITPELSNTNFNKPSLLLPMPAADQFGNLTLFD